MEERRGLRTKGEKERGQEMRGDDIIGFSPHGKISDDRAVGISHALLKKQIIISLYEREETREGGDQEGRDQRGRRPEGSREIVKIPKRGKRETLADY